MHERRLRKRKKETKFKDQIRRLLLIYGVLPMLIVSSLFIGGTYYVWKEGLERDNQNKVNQVGKNLEMVLLNYHGLLEKANGGEQRIDISRLRDDAEYRLSVIQELYRFLNEQEIRAEIYLLDNQRRLLYATNKNKPYFLMESSDISWGLLRRLDQTMDVDYLLKSYNFEGLHFSEIEIGLRLIDEGRTSGYMVCVINEEALYNIIARYNTAMLLVNDYDRVFVTSDVRFQNRMGDLDRQQLSQLDYLVHRYQVLGDRKVVIYSVASLVALNKTILILLFLGGGLLLVVIITMVISSYKIATSKTLLIDQIVEAFTRVQEGDLDSRLDIQSNDEFEIIATTYNRMIESIKELMQRNERQVRENTIFQIRELESQFNPHFLFNTLEVIKYAIKIDSQKATSMILALSKILRYSIDYSLSEVELEKDIDYLENYLYIVSQRFGERFSYLIDVANECRLCKIPKLMFQPIIENTIKYGFGDHYAMEVRVKVRLIEKNLVVVVYDDGIGIDEAKLEELKRNLDNEMNQTRHIGLYNVHRRIRLLYGANYGIQLDSSAESGTVIKINLPVQN